MQRSWARTSTRSKRAILATICLGLPIAAVTLALCKCATPFHDAPTATLRSADAPADGACSGSVDELLVDSTAIGVRREVRVTPRHEARAGELHAEYGNSWAEKKLVTFAIAGRDVRARAEFDTDYGEFGGSIDVQHSHVHQHDDKLCFDLSLERMDGSHIHERWQGQLALR